MIPKQDFGTFENGLIPKITLLVQNELAKAQKNAQYIDAHPANYNRLKWLQSPETLIVFYNILKKHGYIKCEWEDFVIHFIPSAYVAKEIQFLKPTIELVQIFNMLTEKQESKDRVVFINRTDEPHLRLAYHFIDKKGNKLVPGTLGTLLNKSFGKRASFFIQTEIIAPLKATIQKS